jgi:hypothetical protein
MEKIHEAKFENSRKIVEHLSVIGECEEKKELEKQ